MFSRLSRSQTFFAAFAIVAFFYSAIGSAACNSAAKVSSPRLMEFMISGVLQKDSDAVTIKLVHSLEVAANGDAARESFFRAVAITYSGYRLVSSLVTVIDTPVHEVDRPPPQLCAGVAI